MWKVSSRCSQRKGPKAIHLKLLLFSLGVLYMETKCCFSLLRSLNCPWFPSFIISMSYPYGGWHNHPMLEQFSYSFSYKANSSPLAQQIIQKVKIFQKYCREASQRLHMKNIKSNCYCTDQAALYCSDGVPKKRSTNESNLTKYAVLPQEKINQYSISM